MKDRKRLIVYSLLLLPLLGMGIFLLTLDQHARAGFFAEFRTSAKEQFGMAEEIPAANSEPSVAVPSWLGDDTAGPNPGAANESNDLSEQFAEQDINQDGKLTGDEISERIRLSLDLIDADQDGAVSLQEMQNSMGGPDQRGGRGRGRRGQGRGGRGGQGRGGRGGFDPEQLFARLDENGDGKLIGDEIGDRMRENLDSIDSDGDEAITLEELIASREQLGGRRGPESNDSGRNRPARPE